MEPGKKNKTRESYLRIYGIWMDFNLRWTLKINFHEDETAFTRHELIYFLWINHLSQNFQNANFKFLPWGKINGSRTVPKIFGKTISTMLGSSLLKVWKNKEIQLMHSYLMAGFAIPLKMAFWKFLGQVINPEEIE